MNCRCGHPDYLHDYHEGCRKFLCCDRTRKLTPGKRHQEHDGINHTAQHCTCVKYQQGDNT